MLYLRVQVIFSTGERGVLGRTTFEWNRNEFCELFRKTKNANEFIEIWNKNTTFNKISQCSEVASASSQNEMMLEDVDNSNTSHCPSISPSRSLQSPSEPQARKSPATEETSSTQSAVKRRLAEESNDNPPGKKTCISNPLDDAIEAKRVGMCIDTVQYWLKQLIRLSRIWEIMCFFSFALAWIHVQINDEYNWASQHSQSYLLVQSSSSCETGGA